ncbi:MAG: hypothetical protein L0I94_10665 [Yaniella sp.]|uniref:hypothetical protein n=1 Tax=Yaniella sp. TaxID=2773929 RepID=UPI002649116F|nr:hypothetical protein [Yaniella sp.]MDN5818739.1 hypothetical protein [Yaniella sp.]MDN5890011.1 hypothetical protein [Yaniella sp.]MDN6149273.1 hypothetical protein [Yaniella sp.]MDN6457259.1 hypothetical protein [Yaniella sp.]MDN6520352.1 hypothetical protein [Yaniella sp.]
MTQSPTPPPQNQPPPQHQPPPGGQAPPPPVPDFLKEIPAKAWARTFLIVAVFFGGALIMAGVTAGLLTAGASSAAGDAFGTDIDRAFSGGSTWIVMTFQLLAMGFFSPLSIGVDFAEFVAQTPGGSLFLVPWWVPAGGLVAVMTTQRYLGGNLRAPRTGTRLLLAAIGGITFATITTILAAAVRFRFDEGMDMFGASMWAHAASFPGFLVATLVVGLTTYILLLPRQATMLQRAVTSMVQVFEHVVALAAVGVVVLLITGLVQGSLEGIGFILALLPNIGFLLFSMLHFVPAVASGTQGMAELGASETFHIFDAHPGFWIPGILVMLLALGVSAFRWSIRTRFHAHATWAWVALPVTYLLVGSVLTFGNGIYFSMFAEGTGVRAGISSASWGFLIWVVIGAIVQLLAVYLMPALARRFPPGLLRALGWKAAPPAAAQPTYNPPLPPQPDQSAPPQPAPAGEQFGMPDNQTAPLYDVPPPPASAPTTSWETAAPTQSVTATQSPDPADAWQAAATQPREPRQPMSRRTKMMLYAGLGVIVLAAILWIAHTVLARTVFGPEQSAESYLEAVIDGRAEDALDQMGPNVTDEQRALATNEIYQAAESRPDSYDIGEVTRDGTTASVDVTVYQEGKAYPFQLGLTASGTQAGVFRDWSLNSGDIAGRVAYVSGPSSLTVNDVEVEVQPAGALDETDPYASYEDVEAVQRIAEESGQVLLPGTYTFTAPEGSEYLSSGEDLVLTVHPGEISGTPIEFSQRYTEAFETDVVEQIEQRLESCVADETIRIADCEAASWEDTWYEAMTNIERSWATPPEIKLVPADDDPSFGTTSITEYSGPVTARIVEGSIDITYEARNDADDDWREQNSTYSPFSHGWSGAMELPVTLDGDDINIDFSPLDEYNSSWLSDDFQD